jgi:endoglucanase
MGLFQKSKLFLFLFVAIIIFSIPANALMPFLKVEGQHIVTSAKKPITLRGFVLSNFANGNWIGNEQVRPTEIPDWVLTRADVKRLKSMGVNLVRYCFNYDVFDPANPSTNVQKSYQDLDERLRWFEDENIYVILNMHVPPGRSAAFKSKGFTIFENEALWTQFENFWTEMVKRYKGRSVIGAFEFFNEPKVPPQGQTYFEKKINDFVAKMRKIDPTHIFVIPNAESVLLPDGKESYDFQPFFKVKDKNIVYTFHYYEPKEFTHQRFWLNIPANGMKYPFKLYKNAQYVPFQTPMKYKAEERPSKGNGWFLAESKVFTPPKNATYGTLSFVAGNQTGTILFDNIQLFEIDPKGKATEMKLPNPSFKPFAWNYMNKSEFNPNDYYSLGYYVEKVPDDKIKFLWRSRPEIAADEVRVDIAYPGYDDDSALSITNPYTGVTNIFFDQRVFGIEPKPGYQYQVKGLIKKENTAPFDPAKGSFENIDFSWFKAEKEVIDKTWIKKDVIWKYVTWAKKNNVPLFAGEFGTDNFIKNDYRVAWAADLMEILNELNIPWTYWEYKSIYGWGFSFSMINMETDNPDSGLFVNEPLMQKIEGKLKQKPQPVKKVVRKKRR